MIVALAGVCTRKSAEGGVGGPSRGRIRDRNFAPDLGPCLDSAYSRGCRRLSSGLACGDSILARLTGRAIVTKRSRRFIPRRQRFVFPASGRLAVSSAHRGTYLTTSASALWIVILDSVV